jgi:hypothetical protein
MTLLAGILPFGVGGCTNCKSGNVIVTSRCGVVAERATGAANGYRECMVLRNAAELQG